MSDYAEDLALAVGRHRAHLPVLVSKMHQERNHRSGVSPVLEGVAVAYYRIAHARYALQRIPSLGRNARLMKQLHRLESYTSLVWDRLGVYFAAAQWAQKGLATVAVNFTSLPPRRPGEDTPFARLEAQISSKPFFSLSLSASLSTSYLGGLYLSTTCVDLVKKKEKRTGGKKSCFVKERAGSHRCL